MHRIRFSLLAMFGFVAVVAVVCAALARPSQLWLVVVSASALAALFYAVLAATYGRNARRAFWVGFAVVGWGYVAMERENISTVAPTEFVTSQLQAFLGPTASPQVVPAPAGPNDAYAAEPPSIDIPVDRKSVV
jgi:hypothetical protein